MIFKYTHVVFTVLALLILYNGCSNSVDPSEDHFEAVGLYIVANQDTIVRYEAGEVNGMIEVDVGSNSSPLSVLFVMNDGSLDLPPNETWTLDWQVADTSIANVFAEEDVLNYIIRIKGEKIGQTLITIVLNHGDHIDFESLAIPIHVQETVILPKK